MTKLLLVTCGIARNAYLWNRLIGWDMDGLTVEKVVRSGPKWSRWPDGTVDFSANCGPLWLKFLEFDGCDWNLMLVSRGVREEWRKNRKKSKIFAGFLPELPKRGTSVVWGVLWLSIWWEAKFNPLSESLHHGGKLASRALGGGKIQPFSQVTWLWWWASNVGVCGTKFNPLNESLQSEHLVEAKLNLIG